MFVIITFIALCFLLVTGMIVSGLWGAGIIFSGNGTQHVSLSASVTLSPSVIPTIIPTYNDSLYILGSSVSSGYFITGRGCHGCETCNCGSTLSPGDPLCQNGVGPQCVNNDPIQSTSITRAMIKPQHCSDCNTQLCGCYTSLLAWYSLNYGNTIKRVFNYGEPGDCTKTVESNRRVGSVISQNPNFILIGLSTNNEKDGFQDDCTLVGDQTESGNFIKGMGNIITTIKTNSNAGIILGSTYPDHDGSGYDQAKIANVYMNNQPYPMINFMGALDDGTGKFAPGFENPNKWNHPNAFGGTEMYLSIVPTMFDAYKYKQVHNITPLKPEWKDNISQGTQGPLSFIVPDNQDMHSWSIQFFTLACESVNPNVLTIEGFLYTNDMPPTQESSHTLQYTFGNCQTNTTYLVTHSFAMKKIQTFKNFEILDNQTNIRFRPTKFILNDNVFANLCIWRSFLTSDHFPIGSGSFYQGSLEYYSPLDSNVNNLALSTTKILKN